MDTGRPRFRTLASAAVPAPVGASVSIPETGARVIDGGSKGMSLQRVVRVRGLGGAGAVALMLGAGAAAAQSAEPLVLPPLVVTASRTAVEAKEVGSAITVITAEEIERKQVRFVSDILRQVPGVAVNRAGNMGALTQVRIRGAEGNHTLVIIDGVEVNDPMNASEFDFSSLLADDIERIEVLRGPQSAIWGSDTIGGVVNIVTKRGREGVHGRASAEGGSFGTYRMNAGLSGGTEAARASVSGSLFDTDGINVGSTGSEKDGYRNGTLNVTGDVDLSRNLSVALNGRYTKAKTEGDRQDFDFPATPTQGLVVDSDDYTETEQIYGRAEARLSLFDGAWQQKLGAAMTRADRDTVESGTTSESTGTKGKLDYQSTFLFDTPTLADAAHSLTFYVEREHQDFRNRSEGFPSADQYRGTTDHGYVGEYRVGLWDQLFLSAALRFDDNERFEDATTYRGTAAYVVPGSGTRLHASYATGATNPTFFELFGFDPNTFVGNPDLKPETSKGWDAGVEQKFLDDRVLIDVTYFETDLRDEIQTAFLPGFLATPVNLSGKSTRRGIEVTAQARVTDAFDLAGSFTWLDAEEPGGRSEVRRPDYMASASANYRFLGGRANVNLGVDYNGRAIDNEFVDSTGRIRVGLDDYVLVNLAASYRLTDNVELFGRVENLLDEDYQDVYGFDTPGIGAYAGIKVAFDTP